jgi:diguanylate cyclase (GGDEF)-like protein
VVSAILAGLLGAVLTVWLGSFIRTTNIHHATDTAEYSLSLSVNLLNVPAGQTAVITPAQLALTTRLMRASVATGTFFGATSWSAPGIVSYAAEPGRIGRLEKVRPGVTAAFKGRTSTAVISRPLAGVPDPTERSGLREVGPLLEIYAPVYLRGRLVAAVALYQPWQPIQHQIDRETHQMLLLVLAGLLVLWLGVMRLVLSASRRLRRQATENWLLASHDPLTGLPNRTQLNEQVCQALRSSERSGRHVGLLLIDLDRFKEVNDTLGHHSGDLLLKQIGPRLSAALREGDFVARLGGDEFVVVLPTLADPDEAEAAAARLLEALSAPFQLENVRLDVDASIGIAVSPAHGTEFGLLLRHADTGMYEAKKSGGGFATYSLEAESSRAARLAKNARRLGATITIYPEIETHGDYTGLPFLSNK